MVDVIWSKISNALKRLGFRSRTFSHSWFLKPQEHVQSGFDDQVLGRLWNALGAPARLCQRNSRSRTPVAKRIPGGGEPDPESQIQGRLLLSEGERRDWRRSLTGWVKRCWMTWRQRPRPIRSWDGIGSSSRTNLTGAKFRRSVGRPESVADILRLVSALSVSVPAQHLCYLRFSVPRCHCCHRRFGELPGLGAFRDLRSLREQERTKHQVRMYRHHLPHKLRNSVRNIKPAWLSLYL